jgi:hypothetical protein
MLAVATRRQTVREMGDRLFNVLGAIVTVALVTTIVSRPTSATVIRAMGDAFAGSIRAALGQ